MKTRTKQVIGVVVVATAMTAYILHFPIMRSGSMSYHHHQGKVFGTFYNIQYRHDRDLDKEIQERFRAFDASLSTFNPHSTISVLNQGRDTVWDEDFRSMYETAEEVRQASHGAFDIRVAPLVNAWGFGFTHRETLTPAKIDSLRQIRNVLDASAIAKGQSCDVIATLLEDAGIRDYLVDIGGEVVARGHNSKGNPWRVGITKPIDDVSGTHNEIEQVISTTSIHMATSGNYRQFYYEGDQKRSHTIDPRTGYPVQHNLLSATVVANNCKLADALATACMVLGADSALQMIDGIDGASCLLIVGTDHGTEIRKSTHWIY